MQVACTPAMMWALGYLRRWNPGVDLSGPGLVGWGRTAFLFPPIPGRGGNAWRLEIAGRESATTKADGEDARYRPG